MPGNGEPAKGHAGRAVLDNFKEMGLAEGKGARGLDLLTPPSPGRDSRNPPE